MAQWGAVMGALAGGLFGGRKGIERANKMGSCDCGVKRACAKGFKYGTCCSALYSNYLCGIYELFGFCALVIGFTHRSNVMKLRHLVTKTILTEDQMYDLLDVCDDLGISVDEARQLYNFIEGRGCPSVCDDCLPVDCPERKDECGVPRRDDDDRLRVECAVVCDPKTECGTECDRDTRCGDCPEECPRERGDDCPPSDCCPERKDGYSSDCCTDCPCDTDCTVECVESCQGACAA